MSDTVVVHNGKRLVRERGAMATPITNRDVYRSGDAWLAVKSAFEQGRSVDEVKHFGRHQTALGNVVHIRDDKSMEIVGQVQVVDIRMTEVEALTEAEVRELGHDSVDSIRERLGDRRIWFMRTEPVHSTTSHTILQ